MGSSLGLTGSEVKAASDGTLTTEEFVLGTGSGSKFEVKPSNLETALLGSTPPQPVISVLAGQPSMLV